MQKLEAFLNTDLTTHGHEIICTADCVNRSAAKSLRAALVFRRLQLSERHSAEPDSSETKKLKHPDAVRSETPSWPHGPGKVTLTSQ